MNAKELACILNNRNYGDEITKGEEARAKECGLVVVFGASDDLMEFRGAIYDEVDVCNGGTAYLNNRGLLKNDCEDDGCPYFKELKRLATTIEAVWNKDDYAWIYETYIPHETFDIVDDDCKYCRGIVFSMSDVK